MYSEHYEHFWHSPSLELANKLFAEEASYTFQGLYCKGREAIVKHILGIKNTYKVEYKAFDIWEGPELAYHRWEATGVFEKEPLGEFAPTGKDILYSGIAFLRLRNERILEVVSYSDLYDVLRKES